MKQTFDRLLSVVEFAWFTLCLAVILPVFLWKLSKEQANEQVPTLRPGNSEPSSQR